MMSSAAPSEAFDWFSRENLGHGITRIWEPQVHTFFRSNIFHLRGRDVDLVIDGGMGLQPLRPALRWVGSSMVGESRPARREPAAAIHARMTSAMAALKSHSPIA